MTTAIMAYGSGGSYFDAANGAVKQVSLYFYRAGTLDPITVYTTSALQTPHPIPVITTGYGRVPPVWLGGEANPEYRVRAFDQYSTLVEDVDHLPGPEFYLGPETPDDSGTITPGDSRLHATGDLVFAFSNAQPRAGFVLANGLPIGSATSPNAGAGSASDANHNLFLWLWGQDIHGRLPVLPSRGGTAEGDWLAGAAIRTPDLMGRSVVGMDAMGTAAANRLAGVPLDAGGSQAWVGSTGGAALHTLVAAEVPDHTHTLTDPKHVHTGASPDHIHAFSGNTGFQSADHVHSGTTNVENASHQHSYTPPLAAGTVNSGVAFGVATVGNAVNTGSDNANHVHAFSTGGMSASHSHAFNGNTGGSDRSLAFTTSSVGTGIAITGTTGGGGAHNNTPLFMTVAVYIKL